MPPRSNVRHVVLGTTTLMAVLLYLDRVAISAAGPAIAGELKLDKVQMGVVYGAFFFAYALGQVPAGWLSDRYGARTTLAAFVFSWSAFTAVTGAAQGLISLLAIRLLFGVCQAGAYPTTARVYSRWMPFDRRALASSVVSLGGRAGGALAPLLTVTLMELFDGWRDVFVVYALAGVVWAVAFWAWFRETPAEHPHCNEAEVRLIDDSRPAEVTSPHGTARAIPLADMLTSQSLWLQCLSQFAANVGWTLLVTWLPTYLMEVHGVSLNQAGRLASLPPLGGVLGCLCGGIATDWLTQRLGLTWGRRAMGMTSRLLAAGVMGVCLGLGDAVFVSLAFALAWFLFDTGMGATWAYFQDAGGPYVGTLLGWANMFGNLGAALSPILLGGLAKHFGWGAALVTCAAMFVLSSVSWLGVDARVPIVRAGRVRGVTN